IRDRNVTGVQTCALPILATFSLFVYSVNSISFASCSMPSLKIVKYCSFSSITAIFFSSFVKESIICGKLPIKKIIPMVNNVVIRNDFVLNRDIYVCDNTVQNLFIRSTHFVNKDII